MREKDPNSRGNKVAKDPAGEPLVGQDPRIGIPDDDDDPFKGSIIEEPDPSHAVEAAADDSELDFTGIATDDSPTDVSIDVDDEQAGSQFPNFLINSGENSIVAPIPRGVSQPLPRAISRPEPDAPRLPTSTTKRSSSAQLRHDLRTPFNQIFGYSEMLLEDAEEKHDEFVGAHVRQLLSDGRQLLGVIDELLDPKAQRPSQERLNRDLLFPLAHLRTHVERLVQIFKQNDRDEVSADVELIFDAVQRLDEIVSGGAVNKILHTSKPAPEPSQTTVAPSLPRQTSIPRATSDTGRILVVDDNESNRSMLARRLEREGHTVQLADNGKSALHMLRSQDFDLVLLDVMMPEMDGYQVLEQLHADDKFRGLPVIMISALDEIDTVVKSIELGAEDYLPKPFNPVILRARIGACLEKKRLRDRERAYVRKLRSEQERSEQLLLNILPRPIAERLKEGQRTIADVFPDVTVLFADLVGFTRMSEQLPPAELVAMLNRIFSMFDQLAEKHGLEKIKTIGDEYMAASGLPMPRPDHAEAMAEMALDMLAIIERFNAKRNRGVRIRIGLNCGPVTAGIIGTKKFAYDLWGDTVNIASRMESHGIANAVQVTEATYKRLRHKYAFQRRGIIHVKGKGALCTYFLVGRRPQKAASSEQSDVKPAVIVTRHASSVDLSKPITMDVPARVPIIDDD
ncbi:adenylate/guanylate cyclase domain-containing protein [Nannocystis sp. bb15-2]|uniref:histidine kinase n=1 Tax=Nannocystis bainbridge TaxID=2995303 RepID=A0ABT5DYP3_9BACT|nr:adenylate/guanylate cyclase domain-containing protein [Nannocystis bainbridge]MDC0718710.1 adenylate/guanylate cyclase domain-containing protein [Nannocystis bainbridge]